MLTSFVMLTGSFSFLFFFLSRFENDETWRIEGATKKEFRKGMKDGSVEIENRNRRYRISNFFFFFWEKLKKRFGVDKLFVNPLPSLFFLWEEMLTSFVMLTGSFSFLFFFLSRFENDETWRIEGATKKEFRKGMKDGSVEIENRNRRYRISNFFFFLRKIEETFWRW